MKKVNRRCLTLIFLCIVLFLGYRVWDRIRTDTNPPAISFSDEPLQVSVLDPQDVLLKGVSAEDRRDGNVTDSLVVERIKLVDGDGSIHITYAAFDAAGNVTKKVRTAQYTDYRSPFFYQTEAEGVWQQMIITVGYRFCGAVSPAGLTAVLLNKDH